MTLQVFDMQQGSPEWIQARVGVITASCFKDVLAKGQGKTRKTYMMKLAGERIRNEPAEAFGSAHTDRGHEYESAVLDLYKERTGNEVQHIGFMKIGPFGASADGLVGEDGALEIKTKLAHLQAELLLSDKVPSEHMAQIQGNLFVSGRKWVDFVSFCPGMPLFIRRVERNEEYIKELEKELQQFEAELQQEVTKIMAMF